MSDLNLREQDYETYPLTCALREELSAVSDRYAAEYERTLKTVPASSKLEKRAAAISLNMAKLTKTFLCFNYRRVPLAEQMAGCRRVLEREGLYDSSIGDRETFDRLTADEQAEWTQFAEVSFMLRRAFLEKHLDKAGATEAPLTAKEAEQVFESRIVTGTLCTILGEWRRIRQEKGLFPFERYTYEDEPWRENVQEEEG